jgi:hypothetical protein
MGVMGGPGPMMAPGMPDLMAMQMQQQQQMQVNIYIASLGPLQCCYESKKTPTWAYNHF